MKGNIMKIKRSHLETIIAEELTKVLSEQDDGLTMQQRADARIEAEQAAQEYRRGVPARPDGGETRPTQVGS